MGSFVFTPLTPPTGSQQQQHQQQPFSVTVDVIRSEHITAARAAIRDPRLLKELEADIDHDCESLRGFLFATQVRCIYIMHRDGSDKCCRMQVIDEISPRSRDSIIGFGEKLGCKIVVAALQDRVCGSSCVSTWRS